MFNPFLVTAVVGAFLAISWWLLLDEGLASAANEAFRRPGLLLLVFVVTVLSAGFHEFGHAAAARRGGSTPGAMGAGLYLFWPAFYTDVTDSYRLGRGGRLRTDLGGLYFNALVAVAMVGLWWASGYDALLLVVATQILQMLRQLTPIIRFDGYHVLADLTGVPDLYHRIKPTLLGLLPWRWRDPEASRLKPWARAVVTLWVLLVVPLLVFALLTMVLSLPRLLATAWVSLQEQGAILGDAWGEGDLVGVLARILAVIALVLPILGVGYILSRLLRQTVGSVLQHTRDRPVRRTVAGVTAAALVAGLGWVWWPDGSTYRPIAAYEGGTLADVVALARPAPTYPPGLSDGQQGAVQVAWPEGAALPSRDEPQLAVVMLPRPQDGQDVQDDEALEASAAEPVPTPGTTDPGTRTPDATTAPAPETADDVDTDGTEPAPWIFPFDEPLPPDEGDTQALAANTTDESVVYDLAFALVWADGDQVTNTNEAYAVASCTDCAAVAISFQVVLALGDADVVVPQNLAVSATYNCVRCLTYALASQLVVTLSGPLSDDSMAALNEVWAEIAAYAATITTLPLDQIQADLEGFQQSIKDIIAGDPSASPTEQDEGDATAPEESASPSASPEDPASPSATDGASPSSSPSSSSSSPSSSTPPPSSPSVVVVVAGVALTVHLAVVVVTDPDHVLEADDESRHPDPGADVGPAHLEQHALSSTP